MSAPVLEVRDLRVEFRRGAGVLRAVRGLSLEVRQGETFAIVGEAGSGKTVSMLALMRLLESPPAHVAAEALRLDGLDLQAVPDRDWPGVMGERIAMVFQDALTALNPVFTVGWQLAETFRVHRAMGRRERREQSVELLRPVGIPEPERRLDDHPHQFSGGMRQRVMIAMAVALEPRLVIADEPTTALDVTVQAQIMELLRELREERRMSLVLITHDLGLVAESADRLAIMYAGTLVETGTVAEVLGAPRHPYTRALLSAETRVEPGRGGRRPIVLAGEVPSPLRPPSGCCFRTRCWMAAELCAAPPPRRSLEGGRQEALCHFAPAGPAPARGAP